MPTSEYRPDLMGQATLEPSGRFEAGSWQSFKLVYTAGRFGIDDTGSIKIGFRFATDFGPVQFTDPEGPGYTTVEASNNATLDAKWEFKRNIRPWSRSLYVGVVKDFLAPGDTITIRFGDQRFGSPGIRVQTYCESQFEFHVLADPIATYDYVGLIESPRIAVVPGPGVKWFAIAPTLVRTGEEFRLALKIDDKWGNPTDQVERTVKLVLDNQLQGLPASVRLETGKFGVMVEGLRGAEPGDCQIRVVGDDGRELCRSNPVRIVDSQTPLVHFWGDTHGQSNETLGTNTAREYFEFGRDKAHVDVMGHQGNDFQISGAFWRHLNQLSAEFDKPGRFVCIPGYEWSANTAVGGDRNVHYRHEGEPIYRSSHAQIADAVDIVDEPSDAHDAHELFARLKGKDCVVVAHVGGRYADIKFAHDAALETAVEVHSAWGTFEWIVRDALEKNFRVGIVANSDGHKGRPGACYPGASFFGSYGGLTCFLAERLDRDAIFEFHASAEALRNHRQSRSSRCVRRADPRGPCLPARPIARAHSGRSNAPSHHGRHRWRRSGNRGSGRQRGRVRAYRAHRYMRRSGLPGNRFELYDEKDLGARVRLVYEGAEYRGRARTTNWDGLLSIDGNRILRTGVINNWNLDRGIQKQDHSSVMWKAVTTGNYGAIDLWLEIPNTGRLDFKTAPVSGEVAIADLGVEPREFAAGGLDRAIRVQRLPDVMEQTSATLRRNVKLRTQGDTRLYIRVQQEDGHRMWSSPIYLFRQ